MFGNCCQRWNRKCKLNIQARLTGCFTSGLLYIEWWFWRLCRGQKLGQCWSQYKSSRRYICCNMCESKCLLLWYSIDGNTGDGFNWIVAIVFIITCILPRLLLILSVSKTWYCVPKVKIGLSSCVSSQNDLLSLSYLATCLQGAERGSSKCFVSFWLIVWAVWTSITSIYTVVLTMQIT